MKAAKLRRKTCADYHKDLGDLATTGKASDEYIEHLGHCHGCQSKMQSRCLNNIKAQPKRI